MVRYDAAGQDRLAAHTDDSELSFNLLLSDPSAFEGGGTRFEAAGEAAEPAETGEEAAEEGETVRPARGEMLSHFGRLRHAGQPVLEGTRYILAGFVRVRPLAEAWPRILSPVAPREESEDAEGRTEAVV